MWYVRQDSAISSLVKYLLFVFNFLFWLVGISLICVGGWALATKELEKLKVSTSAWDYVFDISIVIIVLGCIIAIISTAGCVGALRENVLLLKSFWISLIMIVLCLVVIGVVGFALNSYFLNLVKDKLSVKWIKNYMDDPDLKDLTDFFQEEFECCGMSDEGFVDWGKLNPYFNCTRENKEKFKNPWACAVPSSCCRLENRVSGNLENFMCGANVLQLSNAGALEKIHTRGCVSAVIESAQKNIFIVCAVVLIVNLVPMIQIYLAVTLISQIQEQKSKWELSHRGPPSGARMLIAAEPGNRRNRNMHFL